MISLSYIHIDMTNLDLVLVLSRLRVEVDSGFRILKLGGGCV